MKVYVQIDSSSLLYRDQRRTSFLEAVTMTVVWFAARAVTMIE